MVRCAGGCKQRMTQEEAMSHAAVICLYADAQDMVTATLTLPVCDACAKVGGKERAEIAALNARAVLQEGRR